MSASVLCSSRRTTGSLLVGCDPDIFFSLEGVGFRKPSVASLSRAGGAVPPFEPELAIALFEGGGVASSSFASQQPSSSASASRVATLLPEDVHSEQRAPRAIAAAPKYRHPAKLCRTRRLPQLVCPTYVTSRRRRVACTPHHHQACLERVVSAAGLEDPRASLILEPCRPSFLQVALRDRPQLCPCYP